MVTGDVVLPVSQRTSVQCLVRQGERKAGRQIRQGEAEDTKPQPWADPALPMIITDQVSSDNRLKPRPTQGLRDEFLVS